MSDRMELFRRSRAVFFIWVVLLTGTALKSFAEDPAKNKIPVELYVMSLCPFGVQAENALLPAVKSLGDAVDFRLYFIAEGTAVFKSLHGPSEVEEDVRQLCARDASPGKYLDYILERNKSYQTPRWREAAESADLDPRGIEACADGARGRELLSENLKAHREKSAFSSPTIYIDGMPYAGLRGRKALTLALCGSLREKGLAAPGACREAESLPDDVLPTAADACGGGATAADFDIQVVVDKDCAVCEPTLLSFLKHQHPGARVHIVDADSKEGRALVRRHGAKALPLYVLDKKVEEDPYFGVLRDSLYAKSGDAYVVRPGSYMLPNVQLERKRVPRHLDVFVNPLSPAAVLAEAELIRFLEESDIRDLTFSFHYILQEGARAEAKPAPAAAPRGKTRKASLKELAGAAPGPLTSVSGEEAVRESRLQACLFQNVSAGTFFTYLACRSHDLADPAQAGRCLASNDAVRACVDGEEGEKLLRADAVLARELDITGGAAILWENRYGPFSWNEIDWRRLLADGAQEKVTMERHPDWQ